MKRTLDDVECIMAEIYDELLKENKVRTQRSAWVWVQIKQRMKKKWEATNNGN